MRHLVFQLYGAMSSWGGVAPASGNRRSDVKPLKSGVLGMVGAALGKRRDEDEYHRELADTFGVAVRVVSRGELLVDFHTSQMPSKGKRMYYTRRDEIVNAEKGLNTVLSERDYRVDAYYVVSLWVHPGKDEAFVSLEEIAEALRKPFFTLYLGRKCCPLSLPLCPQIVQKDTLRDVFSDVTFPHLEEFVGNGGVPVEVGGDVSECVWEEHPKAGMIPRDVRFCRDQLVSRVRWQYRNRKEYYGVLANVA